MLQQHLYKWSSPPNFYKASYIYPLPWYIYKVERPLCISKKTTAGEATAPHGNVTARDAGAGHLLAASPAAARPWPPPSRLTRTSLLPTPPFPDRSSSVAIESSQAEVVAGAGSRWPIRPGGGRRQVQAVVSRPQVHAQASSAVPHAPARRASMLPAPLAYACVGGRRRPRHTSIPTLRSPLLAPIPPRPCLCSSDVLSIAGQTSA